MNRKLKKILIILFWIAVWALGAWLVSNPLILASPVDVVIKFTEEFCNSKFWITIVCSLFRITIGFIIACVLGYLLALISSRFKTFYDFINPLIQLAKSAPIVCFIVLLLVWVGVNVVDIITIIIAVVPVYYFAIYQALMNINKDIENMLKVYKVSPKIIRKVFYWPSITPYFKQATQVSVGLSWKSGITAQMIGIVAYTVGEGVYNSKVFMDSSQLLVWMFIVILLSWLCEKIILMLIKKFTKKQITHTLNSYPEPVKQENRKANALLVISDISKSYGNNKVLDKFTLKVDSGSKILISGPTGSGKTTLTNIIMGITQPDQGEIFIEDYKPRTFSAVFQTNTLLEDLTVKENIILATNKIPKSELVNCDIMCKELSGGMKRCAQIERAIIAESQIVILDEPFVGLDEETKSKAIDYINKNIGPRTLILISHDKLDAKNLNCEVVNI